jgi:CsoR family transcriptional regulator, copper-sensing transcriptional repressor
MKTKKSVHPDHSKEIARVRKIIGQLEGVEKMIVDRRYCPQILQQIKAASAALNALKAEVLKKHLKECVSDSIKTGNYQKMLDQVVELIHTQVRI